MHLIFSRIAFVILAYVFANICTWVEESTEATGVRLLRAGVTGGCEPLHIGTENKTQVLFKSNLCS